MRTHQRKTSGARARHNNKLTEEQVRSIREQYNHGIRRRAAGPTMRDLGAQFGVSPMQIFRVVSRRQWRDVA